jgi:hypothetical protein
VKKCKLDNYIILESSCFSRVDSVLYQLKLVSFDFEKYIEGKNFYGHDHLLFSYIFDLKNAKILEDGLSNYRYSTPNRLTILRRLIMGKVLFTHGFGASIKCIYLSNIEDIPACIEKKVTVFDIKDLLSNVAKYFSEVIYTGEISSVKGVILFTQPLSEDGFISEEEKKIIYLNIIKKYDVEFIKPHPREKTNYSDISNIEVLDKNVPAEVIIYNNNNIKKLVTLFSSSLLNMKKINPELNVIIIGENLEDILKRNF